MDEFTRALLLRSLQYLRLYISRTCTAFVGWSSRVVVDLGGILLAGTSAEPLHGPFTLELNRAGLPLLRKGPLAGSSLFAVGACYVSLVRARWRGRYSGLLGA
jgi:hypothetical protein